VAAEARSRVDITLGMLKQMAQPPKEGADPEEGVAK